MAVADQAFVTLATSDIYCQGALVLGQSLRSHGTTRRLVVMVSPQVSEPLRAVLSRVFDEVVGVDLMASEARTRLAFVQRPELGLALTKLQCWALTQYSKCVFLDADTLVLANIDELFDRTELSAAPDPGWPDCFNSAVFVFQPSLDTHSRLMQHASDYGSADGADQGLLNSFFRSWATADPPQRLPFLYNLSSSPAYTYSAAFQKFGARAKVVHFLGSRKPWSYAYDPQTGSVVDQGPTSGSVGRQQEPFLSLWWRVYHGHVLPLCACSPAAPGSGVSPGGTDLGCVSAVPGAGEPRAGSAPSAGAPPPCAPAAPEPGAAVGQSQPCSGGRRAEDQPEAERTTHPGADARAPGSSRGAAGLARLPGAAASPGPGLGGRGPSPPAWPPGSPACQVDLGGDINSQ